MKKIYKKRATIVNNFMLTILALLLFCNSSDAQSKQTYSGNVKDKSNELIIGATVVVRGTNSSVITDIDGNYSIDAVAGDIIDIAFIGYINQEVKLGNNLVNNVILEMDILNIDEVVVVGYGVSRKSDLTGATDRVSSKDFNQGAVSNPLQQIAGRSAGVNISQTGSEPGAGPSIRIRGITSLMGGSDPLVVIDGIQGDLDFLNQIPTSEIESMDILKDASATAIYGSRGAAGVIIVTTKKSKKGTTSIEYSGSGSIDLIANTLDIMDAADWRKNAATWNVGSSADNGGDTDWFEELTKAGSTQNHTVSFGANNGEFNYRASLSATTQKGVVINSSNNNYNARLQATQKAIDDKLTISLNLSINSIKNQGSPSEVGRADFKSNLISNAYVSRPTDPLLNSDGTYFFDADLFQYINPYAVAETVINEYEKDSRFGSFKAGYDVTGDLNLSWFGSWKRESKASGYYAPVESTLNDAIENEGVANVSTDIVDEQLMDISVNYNKTIDKHKVSAVAVYEWQQQIYQGHFAQTKGFINDITTYNALQLGSVGLYKPDDISSYKNDRTQISVLGRVNYNFDDRYLFTASVRRDGSSVFGANNQWGTFPSASAAWRLSNESFLKNSSVVSNLKLRAGYGVTGNQQGLSPQKSLQLVGSSGNVYFNGKLISNFGVTQNANEDLTWETRKQLNIGVDFGFFDGNLNGSIDLFTADTDNLLFDYTVPQPPYPYNKIAANVGSINNKGIELALNWRVINNDNLTLKLGGNFSFLDNEVTKLGGEIGGVSVDTDNVSWGNGSYLIEGEAIGTFNMFKHTGKDAETNEETVMDIDNSGDIDLGSLSKDRALSGSAIPTYTFAFIPSLSYKNFDLSMVIRGSGGNMVFNRIKKDFSLFEKIGKSNMLKSSEELGLFTTKYESDLWLEKGDYVRLDNVTVGYNVNCNRINHISNLRFTVTGNNLALFSKYSGLDPELNVSGGSSSGVDAGIYPKTRSIAVGVNVSFF